MKIKFDASIENRTHGYSRTKTYDSWHSMKANMRATPEMLDKSWIQFERFLEDMGERPVGFVFSRKDKKKGFYKSNCEWVEVSPVASREELDQTIKRCLIKMDLWNLSIIAASKEMNVAYGIFYKFINGKSISHQFLDKIIKWCGER